MAIRIENARLDKDDILGEDKQNEVTLFIFSVGYEDRSVYQFEKYFNNINCQKICFIFDDYKKHDISRINYKKILEKCSASYLVNYRNNKDVISTVERSYKLLKENYGKVNLHIDYSSMPRGWYCDIFAKMYKIIDNKDRIYFWYTEGEYQEEIESWPSAGLNEIEIFSGKASLRPKNNRTHVFGLGYDNLRTQAIYSVLDPGSFIVTCSYPYEQINKYEKIKKINLDLVNASAYVTSLPIDDFQFSICKLKEIVNEIYQNGDIILVPDGPKPQIFASSIIPIIINKDGIVCIHVSRHEGCYKPINATATGNIYGFLFQNI